MRYSNVYGYNQSPSNPYCGVIGKFIEAAFKNKLIKIHGDGEHSRDFTYVANAVLANELALFTEKKEAVNQVYNVACGGQTTLNELLEIIKAIAGSDLASKYGPERQGDVKHSMADITKANQLLSYQPVISIREGLKPTFEYYRKQFHFAYS